VLSIESACKQQFTINSFHKHKWNACKVGREAVRKDTAVVSAFNKLMSNVACEMNIGSEVKGMVQRRILKRYLNMRCKEFVKVLKQELKYKKTKEHRKKVQERKQKLTNGTKALVHQLIEDSSTGKAVSFHTLKALAAKGIGNFTKITKKRLISYAIYLELNSKNPITKKNLNYY
jgi:hypothetical protein